MSEAIHTWFSLTYANYLVLPRSVLQSMPDEWQERFVALMDEMDDSYGHLDWPTYDVRALARARERLEYEQCPDCGGRANPNCDLCGGLGEVEANRWETAEEVGVITDPIPHYNRGRTRIEPASARPEPQGEGSNPEQHRA